VGYFAQSKLFNTSPPGFKPLYDVCADEDDLIGSHLSVAYLFNQKRLVNLGLRKGFDFDAVGSIPINPVFNDYAIGLGARFEDNPANHYDLGTNNIPIKNRQLFSAVAGLSFQSGDYVFEKDYRCFAKDVGTAMGDHTFMFGTQNSGGNITARSRVGFGGSRALETLFAGNLSVDKRLNLIAVTYDGSQYTLKSIDGSGSFVSSSEDKTGDVTFNNDPTKIARTGTTADRTFKGWFHFLYFIDGLCLTDDMLMHLHYDAFSPLRPKPRLVWVSTSTGGPAADLAGDAAGNVSASGDLQTGISMQGDASGDASASGSITTGIEVTGAALGDALAGGALDTGIDLSGVAASVVTANGSLTAKIEFSGAALAEALATGSLDAGALFSGDAAADASAQGQISTQITLSGSALVESLASADLTSPGSGLSGAVSGEAAATGDLDTGIDLAGQAQAFVSVSGGLSTIIRLEGAVVSVANSSGDLSAQITFDAAALAQALAQGDLTAEQGLSGAALADALASASMTTQIPLSVTALAEAAASGVLGSYIAASGWLEAAVKSVPAVGAEIRLNYVE